MAKSIALAADPSRLASLLLSYTPAVCAFVAPRQPGASAAIIDRLSHPRALLALTLFALACSDGTRQHVAAQGGATGGGDETANDALIVPTDLEVTAAADGACGVLSVTALTLQQGQTNAELYVALRNSGGTPACSPAFSVEVFDKAENAVATGLGGLLVRRFYRLTDGSGTLAACVGPGDVSMLAIRDFPPDFTIADVKRVAYRCTFWSLEAEPVGELHVTDVRSVPRAAGVAFEGALVNGLDVPLDKPSVAVFPLTRAGRPLGVALSDADVEVAPGGSWEFETNVAQQAGARQAAYPMSGP